MLCKAINSIAISRPFHTFASIPGTKIKDEDLSEAEGESN